MGAEVFFDSIDIESRRVSARAPASLEERWEGYPSLPLEIEADRRVMTLRTVCLENPFLRAVICPDLGGRLIALDDRRRSAQILALPGELPLASLPPRGAASTHGVEIVLGPHPRPGSLGRVREMLREPAGEGEPAGLFLHELVPGTGLGWTACWSMPADRAELKLELRTSRRSFGGAGRAAPGLRFWGAEEAQAGAEGVFGAKLPRGLAVIHSGLETTLGPSSTEGAIDLLFSPEPLDLAPRQAVSQKFTMTFAPGWSRADAAGLQAAIRLEEGRLEAIAHERLPGARLTITDREGGRHFASVDLEPDAPLLIEADILRGCRSVRLEDSEQSLICEWPAPAQRTGLRRTTPAPAPEIEGMEISIERARPMADSSAHPGSARSAEAARRMAQEDWAGADKLLQESLTHGSDDALAWTMKALVQLRLEPGAEERPESMAAHGIDPLEPMLRVESWLAQGLPESREASPLLRPLAEDRELGLDAFHHLALWGLEKEALSLADDLLRAAENPLLRLMMAWLLIRNSRMDAESAGHVQQAFAKGIEPPFPHRPMEARALQALAERFPNEPRLAALARLARG
jgi:hypothetical protein